MKQIIALCVLMSIICSANAAADSMGQPSSSKNYDSKIKMIEQETSQIEDSLIHRDQYLAQNNAADNSGLQIKIVRTKKSVQ